MKIYSDRTILFRTQPMLNDFMFRKVCDRFLDDHDDIDMEYIRDGYGMDELTIYDIILDNFFVYKYVATTQITGHEHEDIDDYKFEWADAELEREFKEILADIPGGNNSEALYKLFSRHIYDILNQCEADDENREHIDEMINEYMFDKAMEED